jgi:hypothetical protein
MSSFVSHVYNEKITPDMFNTEVKRVNGFVGALLYWKRVEAAYPKLKFEWRNYNYSNKDVSISVYLKKIPVPVEVNAAKIGAVKHWVLFVGDRKMMDPWTGKISPTSTYPTTGSSIYTISNR